MGAAPGSANHTIMTPSSGAVAQRFWTLSAQALCDRLQSTVAGLTDTEAQARLAQYGPNADAPPQARGLLVAVGRRLREPLSLILLGAGAVSVSGWIVNGSRLPRETVSAILIGLSMCETASIWMPPTALPAYFTSGLPTNRTRRPT